MLITRSRGSGRLKPTTLSYSFFSGPRCLQHCEAGESRERMQSGTRQDANLLFQVLDLFAVQFKYVLSQPGRSESAAA